MNRRVKDLSGAGIIISVILLVFVSCMSNGVIIADPQPPPPPHGPPGEPPKIPPGYMPPPGKCRIWYPDLPPGQQPPPGDCEELERRVPRGAWLIRGSMPPELRSTDLRVLQLEMSPDPVREGQLVTFQLTLSNLSQHSERVTLFLKDRDEVVTLVHDVPLRPGQNRVSFPPTNYRFSRADHCFSVEVDIEKTRRPVDMVKAFCARRTSAGWSMSDTRVGPLLVEDLKIAPDPVRSGERVRFTLRLRNDGNPVRANIRIQDRDQVVIQLNDATLQRGRTDFQFPYTQYVFQRFDHCFTVMVDVEKTLHRVDSVKEFCAKPTGWTLKP